MDDIERQGYHDKIAKLERELVSVIAYYADSHDADAARISELTEEVQALRGQLSRLIQDKTYEAA